ADLTFAQIDTNQRRLQRFREPAHGRDGRPSPACVRPSAAGSKSLRAAEWRGTAPAGGHKSPRQAWDAFGTPWEQSTASSSDSRGGSVSSLQNASDIFLVLYVLPDSDRTNIPIS